MKTAILCMQASGFRNVLPDLEVALAAILADPYRSELCDQLDSMAEFLIDEGEIDEPWCCSPQPARNGLAKDRYLPRPLWFDIKTSCIVLVVK